MTLQWNPSTVGPSVQADGFRIQVGGDEAPGPRIDLAVSNITGFADEQAAFDLMVGLRAWLIANVNTYTRTFTTPTQQSELEDL